MIKKIIFLLTTNRCKENKWTIRQHKVEGRVIGFPLWLTQSLLKDEVSKTLKVVIRFSFGAVH